MALAGSLLALAVTALALLDVTPPNTIGSALISPIHRQVTSSGNARAPAISPDGTRMAYVSDTTPDKTLMVQELSDGQPIAIVRAPEIGHLRWSPDGSHVMVWARGGEYNGLYVIPQRGGTPRRIAAGQYLGTWSPDGSTIAVPHFIGGTIRFFDTEGFALRTLHLQGAHWSIWDIDWSPFNGLLTLVSNDYQGRYSIWAVRPDGNEQRRLFTHNGEIASARWAGKANAIYLSRRVDQTVSIERLVLERVSLDRAASVTPVLTGLETDGALALSADGTRLLYARHSYHSNLWRIDVDGRDAYAATDAKVLTTGTSLVERPELSPDGTTIVFNIGRQPRANLYTMPVAGGTAKQLTFLDAFSVGGAWSPDGRAIAFASTVAGAPRAWIVDAGGGAPRPVASADVSDTFTIAWAPASRILFQQPGNRNFHALDPRSREHRMLVENSDAGWMFSPTASPDGRLVAVFWNRRPDPGIWVIDTKDAKQKLIYKTASRMTTMPLRWSADGQAVYLVEGKPGQSRGLTTRSGETLTAARIVRVAVDGGAPRTVASIPFGEVGGVTITPGGRTLVFAVYSASPSDVWLVDHFDDAYRPPTARR
jgi:Tol biopolymer transport system component